MDTIHQLIKDVGLEGAQKLIGMFQEDATKRISIVGDYAKNGGDLKDLRLQAHTLKGLCLTYGALKAGEAAKDLQSACDDGNETLIKEQALIAFNIIPIDVKAVANFMKTLAEND